MYQLKCHLVQTRYTERPKDWRKYVRYNEVSLKSPDTGCFSKQEKKKKTMLKARIEHGAIAS